MPLEAAAALSCDSVMMFSSLPSKVTETISSIFEGFVKTGPTLKTVTEFEVTASPTEVWNVIDVFDAFKILKVSLYSSGAAPEM